MLSRGMLIHWHMRDSSWILSEGDHWKRINICSKTMPRTCKLEDNCKWSESFLMTPLHELGQVQTQKRMRTSSSLVVRNFCPITNCTYRGRVWPHNANAYSWLQLSPLCKQLLILILLSLLFARIFDWLSKMFRKSKTQICFLLKITEILDKECLTSLLLYLWWEF